MLPGSMNYLSRKRQELICQREKRHWQHWWKPRTLAPCQGPARWSPAQERAPWAGSSRRRARRRAAENLCTAPPHRALLTHRGWGRSLCSLGKRHLPRCLICDRCVENNMLISFILLPPWHSKLIKKKSMVAALCSLKRLICNVNLCICTGHTLIEK